MIEIDPSSPVAFADQIARGIRRAIAQGDVGVGAELPSVRQLANDLDVNFNTVARAYRTLEACGLIRSARGRGTRVTARLATRRDEARLRRDLDSALVDARLAGMSRREVRRLVDRALAELWPAPSRRGEARA